jgi:hypothetical protein
MLNIVILFEIDLYQIVRDNRGTKDLRFEGVSILNFEAP